MARHTPTRSLTREALVGGEGRFRRKARCLFFSDSLDSRSWSMENLLGGSGMERVAHKTLLAILQRSTNKFFQLSQKQMLDSYQVGQSKKQLYRTYRKRQPGSTYTCNLITLTLSISVGPFRHWWGTILPATPEPWNLDHYATERYTNIHTLTWLSLQGLDSSCVLRPTRTNDGMQPHETVDYQISWILGWHFQSN